MTEEEKKPYRDAGPGKIIEAISSFCAVKDHDLHGAVLMAMLLCADDKDSPGHVSDDDLAIALEWVHGIRQEVTMLRLFLIGATDIAIVDGEVAFRIPKGRLEITMDAMVRHGIATPNKVK